MKIGILTFSQKGYGLGEKLSAYFTGRGEEASLTRCGEGRLAEWTKAHFAADGALVFVGSAGIAVRAIAPYVQSKTEDPAVVVVDELGTYAIPLLSGHLGGANALAIQTACLLGALPVITTATDINGVFAVDVWAKGQGLIIANPERIKWISARLLAGETIRVKSKFPLLGQVPAGLELTEDEGAYDILLTYRTRGKAEALRLVPPIITLGIGCKKDTDVESIEAAYELMLGRANCHPAAVRQVCSIDQKAKERAILEFCHRHALPYRTFSAAQLAALPGTFAGSDFVRSVTGVDNVCERSAVLGSGAGGRLLAGKDAGHGVTMALAIAPCTLRFDEGGKEA
ncbi:MAG: cobalamin biosynthesis protein [Candidatus Pelethousia sp.]|nr:cobalamin biosynthesis protein [Candidatus Pelethousia sp.]